MTTIELARALAAHGETDDAHKAYALSLEQADGSDPAAELEAAVFLLENGGDYRVPYTYFHSLYNRGFFQEELFDLMVQAFYAPNMEPLEQRYQHNCALLADYPYLFRTDFLPFEDLPVKLFPFDDEGYLPFDVRENRFSSYVNPRHPVVSRNFFADLEQPIFAQDVFSQYELEYLCDNVRKSEWVARDNHIYLHYTDWGTFCSYLQWLDLEPLLREEKLVFLMEEESSLYPIDFKARFGIDYSRHPVRPIGIREVKKLIWHTQLSSHNGGDFFNEIFYGHPNLLAYGSVILEKFLGMVAEIKEMVAAFVRKKAPLKTAVGFDREVLKQLVALKDPTDKDITVAIFLSRPEYHRGLDHSARIAPALFFQPHFYNLYYQLYTTEAGQSILDSEQYRAIQTSPLFQSFPYIKTFSPMRRLTTSYAASVRFMHQCCSVGEVSSIVGDTINDRLLNRSFMVSNWDRLYQDSVLVRFEDGKLNPTATFTALAAFLDLPYTQSLTYCSGPSGINPESMAGNALGFDPAPVYRSYDEYANDAERYFLEYFMRDVYETYGYDLQYYDGQPVDEEKARALIAGFTTLNRYIRESVEAPLRKTVDSVSIPEESIEQACNQYMESRNAARIELARTLLRGLRFVDTRLQPLRMMPLLKLDPALLEQPLYH